MLTQRATAFSRFTRNDATRLGIASVIIILVMTAILGADVLPRDSLTVRVGAKPVASNRSEATHGWPFTRL